jgi:hypothetical protein
LDWRNAVADEQIVRLLEEIKDLQKQHLEKYKEALENQHKAIEMQKGAVRRQKIMFAVLAVFVMALIALGLWTSHS